ncbi:unnamed protein product [Darwinula stevensoni]|uniref:Uncharacterized protein n=1 Tax=Darwinula stevensoni TaxID=69355 RepID=A0A7R9A765_9CRUS|nr:unnamed protein product [Darwinula stevensoni]CAG0890413.1 unnamed protein product [Darwinula stevensoni]
MRSQKIFRLVVEHAELSSLMFWLSTLGGAYSSLGETYSYCAEMAGQISQKQLKIALTQGDPITASKCKLFAALSLIQTGRFLEARRIIREQWNFSQSLPESGRDVRLERMCQGIWHKLRCLQLRKSREQKVSSLSSLPFF